MRYSLTDLLLTALIASLLGLFIGTRFIDQAHTPETTHAHPHAPEPIHITCNLDEIGDPTKLQTTLTQEGQILYTLTKLSPSDCHVGDTTARPAHVTLIWAD